MSLCGVAAARGSPLQRNSEGGRETPGCSRAARGRLETTLRRFVNKNQQTVSQGVRPKARVKKTVAHRREAGGGPVYFANLKKKTTKRGKEIDDLEISPDDSGGIGASCGSTCRWRNHREG